MTPLPIGIIANPASGKDIRRLVAQASVFNNQEKRAIVRRAVGGALAGGAERFLYMPDAYGIVVEAANELRIPGAFTPTELVDTHSALDTIRAAREMRAAGCGAVISLGGDGTNRAVALGWRDAPLLAISTGTNNVFPRMMEATVGGAAAGLVASGQLGIDEVAPAAKVVSVEVEGEKDDLALVDAVFLDEQFVGARAIWEPGRLRLAVLTRAEPASVGISSIGGLLRPVGQEEEHGLLVIFGGPGGVRAPIAPGLYRPVPVREARILPFDEPIAVEGPGVLAFDGERERVLQSGQRAVLRIRRDGPRVIDVQQALQLAAVRGLFAAEAFEVNDGD